MHDLLSKGGFHDVVQVHPGAGAGAAGSIGHQGVGVLAFGSDGGYINGVAMFALQSLMFFAVDNDLPTTLPPQLLQDLACVPVRYTQHASTTLRSASILRDTATQAALNRPLDPVMLAGVVEQVCGSGAAHSDELDDIIMRYNEHFSDQQKLKLSGVSEAIKAAFIEEKTEALKLQDKLAIVTINISPTCMNPGSMRMKEPRQAAVEEEVWKRKRLDSKALAENTLTLATRNPIMSCC